MTLHGRGPVSVLRQALGCMHLCGDPPAMRLFRSSNDWQTSTMKVTQQVVVGPLHCPHPGPWRALTMGDAKRVAGQLLQHIQGQVASRPTDVVIARAWVAVTNAAMSILPKHISALERALPILRNRGSRYAHALAMCQGALGMVCFHLGEIEEGSELLRPALNALKAEPAAHDLDRLAAACFLAECAIQMNDPAKALAALDEVRQASEDAYVAGYGPETTDYLALRQHCLVLLRSAHQEPYPNRVEKNAQAGESFARRITDLIQTVAASECATPNPMNVSLARRKLWEGLTSQYATCDLIDAFFDAPWPEDRT